ECKSGNLLFRGAYNKALEIVTEKFFERNDAFINPKLNMVCMSPPLHHYDQCIIQTGGERGTICQNVQGGNRVINRLYCKHCKRSIKKKTELVTTREGFKVAPYHAVCYTENFQRVRPSFLLTNGQLNGVPGNIGAVTAILFGMGWLIFVSSSLKYVAFLMLIPIVFLLVHQIREGLLLVNPPMSIAFVCLGLALIFIAYRNRKGHS